MLVLEAPATVNRLAESAQCLDSPRQSEFLLIHSLDS